MPSAQLSSDLCLPNSNPLFAHNFAFQVNESANNSSLNDTQRVERASSLRSARELARFSTSLGGKFSKVGSLFLENYVLDSKAS